jgi:hypothetical protein
VEKCAHCPLARDPTACPAVAHPRYCELADRDGPDFHPGAAEVIRRKAGFMPVAPTPPVAPAAPQRTLSPEQTAAIGAVARCPHKLPAEGCGCNGLRLCGPEGRRPGEKVAYADCLACVAPGVSLDIPANRS